MLSNMTASVLLMVQEQAAEPHGVALFLALFVALYILTTPCTFLETTAGFLFGWSRGFLIGVLGKVIGTALSFFLARTLLRGWVTRRFSQSAQFRTLERMIQNTGFTGLFLSRFLPSIVKNYGIALLHIAPGKMALACIANIVPLSALWASVGSSAKDLMSLSSGPSLFDGLASDGQRNAAMALLWVAFAALGIRAKREWARAGQEIALEMAAAKSR